ncbi:hypothetical protein PPTG_24888, partial [Phytophthora nicotianae INRA-310]
DGADPADLLEALAITDAPIAGATITATYQKIIRHLGSLACLASNL